MSNTTQTSKTLDSYSKARMEIMVKDEIPNLLQDIQRTYIFDFMPETVHGENHIICSYCEQDFKDYADDDYLFHYQEETYCSVFCIQLRFTHSLMITMKSKGEMLVEDLQSFWTADAENNTFEFGGLYYEVRIKISFSE